jgi:hypothetical protein
MKGGSMGCKCEGREVVFARDNKVKVEALGDKCVLSCSVDGCRVPASQCPVIQSWTGKRITICVGEESDG